MPDNSNEKLDLLYIEDNVDHQRIVHRLFKKRAPVNFSFHVRASGKEGMKILEEKTIDLILLDYDLPDISGLELLKEIKSSYEIPVVMLTSQGDEKIAVDAIKHGSEDYITKSQMRNEKKKVMEISEFAFKDEDESKDQREISRVFIVEDEEYMRDLLSYFLKEDKNLELVGEADSSSEFYEKYNSLDPDIILLDINLPGEDGIKITEEIKSSDKDKIVIICSGLKEDKTLKKSLEVGADDYIVKPFQKTSLLKIIRKNVNKQKRG